MEDRMAIKKFRLGTAVKITTVLSVNTADTAKITIDDPTEAVMVNNVDMTKEADKIYSYVYQSDEDDDEGDYVITIKVTQDSYESVVQDKFTLVEQD